MAPPVLDKLAILALSPLGSAVLLWLFSGLLWAMLRRGLAWGAAALGAIWLAVWSLPVVSHALAAHLESRYAYVTPATASTAEAIVLLGGGVLPATVDHPRPAPRNASDRVWHVARLFKAGRAPIVVVSGGGSREIFTTTEASAMRELLLELGLPAGAVLLEDRSRNTRENAAYTAELLRARGMRRILLVTSAWHMARAEPLFVAQGLEVIPAPADFLARDLSRRPWWQRWLPDAEALEMSARLIKEWVGARAGVAPAVVGPSPQSQAART